MRGKVLKRLAPHAKTIVDRYENGANFEQLALEYRCAAATIRRFLLTQDVKLRRTVRAHKLDPVGDDVVQMYVIGTSIAEIARKHNVSQSTVRNYLLDKILGR